MARRRMSAQDSFWLELDRPTNLLVITSLVWTEQPVDPERLRQVIRERVVERYPVYTQRPVLHGGLIRTGYWEDDPDFDLDRHIVVSEMPAPGDRAALQEFVAEQRSVPLDREHPLWRVYVLQGYQGGSAIVQRYHHAMADGVRLTQVMLSLLDPAEQPVELTARVGGRTPVAARRGMVRPVASALNTVASVFKIGLWGNPWTALDGEPGIEKTAAWTDPVPLQTIRGIARATGTTVNDVCTTLVAGTMARYFEQRPDAPRLAAGDDDVAWMVPVNLDPPEKEPPRELGNHFALVLAVLPHGPAAFRDRLAEVHRRIVRIRDSWEPAFTFGLTRGIALSPSAVGEAAIWFLAAKGVGVLTNVPGPREPVSFAGARVAGCVAWAPTSGKQTLTVCIFSYADGVTFGFGTDRRVIPDPDRLVAALQAELADAEASVAGAPGPPGEVVSSAGGGAGSARPAGRGSG